MVKTRYLNLKAPNNNVKVQLDKTLTIQNYFPITKQQMGFSVMRLGNKSTKRRNNEAKFKNPSTFFKTNNFQRLRNHKLLKK